MRYTSPKQLPSKRITTTMRIEISKITLTYGPAAYFTAI